MKYPSGCPNDVARPTNVFVRDTYRKPIANDRTDRDQTACLTSKKRLDDFCGISDTIAKFVPSTGQALRCTQLIQS